MNHSSWSIINLPVNVTVKGTAQLDSGKFYFPCICNGRYIHRCPCSRHPRADGARTQHLDWFCHRGLSQFPFQVECLIMTQDMPTNYYSKIGIVPEWLVANTGTLSCPDNRLCNRNIRETRVPYWFRNLWVSTIWCKLQRIPGRYSQLSWQKKLERSLFPSWYLKKNTNNKQKFVWINVR